MFTTEITANTTESENSNVPGLDINKLITIVYISIQGIIALTVSFICAYHIRQSLNKSKSKSTAPKEKSGLIHNKGQEEEHEFKNTERHQTSAAHLTINTEDTAEYQTEKRYRLCKLWLGTVWKMRGIYSSLAVHSFDVLTDVLVIIEWLNMENIEGDNIDPQVMAYCAITVFIFSKIISSFAMFSKEKDLIRSLLQLFDLLIFVEIYEAHKKVVSQIRNCKDEKKAIESTLSFKYIRQFEAVFESIPESVLQLVFIMRTGFNNVKSSLLPIFIISIIQSIVSMVNSITNNDYTRMQDDKFKRYKQRLPPSFQCFKHFLSRFSEVVHRIALLALFWTVCGGQAFGVLLVYELFILVYKLWALYFVEESFQFNQETILLHLNSVIVIPSEEFYAHDEVQWTSLATIGYSETMDNLNCASCLAFAVFFCIHLCICFSPASCIIGVPISLARCDSDVNTHYIPLFRISASLCEFVFLIFWGAFGVNGSRFKFLFDWNHGLSVFIVAFVFYIIFTQYLMLFPNFDLPFSVNVRSKWGYSYGNELSELQKIKIPKNSIQKKTQTNISMSSDKKLIYDVPMEIRNGVIITPAIIALVSGYHDMVSFMEGKGAVSHKDVDIETMSIPNKKEIEEYITNPIRIKQFDNTIKTRYTANSAVYQEAAVVLEGNLEHLGKRHEGGGDIDDINDDQDDNDEKEVDDSHLYIDNLGGLMPVPAVCDIRNESEFWDEPFKYVDGKPLTAAVFAMEKCNNDIVQWLEERGAVLHKNVKLQEVFQHLSKESAALQ